MIEHIVQIDTGLHKIIDLDADEQGNYIALFNNGAIVTKEHRLQINMAFSFPFIRKLNSNKFLIVYGRTDGNNNAYMYDFSGQLIKSFLAGDGIQDIIIHRNKIIATYFDEGVYGIEGPNNDGLAVFNFNGIQEFGVNSSAADLIISDCYCICKHGADQVLFYSYTGLNIFELNLDTFKLECFEAPDNFSGASAISSIEENILLHSSYHDKRSFFLCDKKTNEVIKFGDYSPKLTGIGNGKFLSFGEKGYTIIDPL